MHVRDAFGGNFFFLKRVEKSFFCAETLLHSQHLWSRTVPIQTANIVPLFCLHSHVHFLALSLFAHVLDMFSVLSILVCGGLLQREDNLCSKQREKRENRNRRPSLNILHYDDDSVCSDLVYLFVIPLCTTGGKQVHKLNQSTTCFLAIKKP